MSSTRPIRTVRDLSMALSVCPPDAFLTIVPEQGEGFPIGGILQIPNLNGLVEVWLLLDEFGEVEPSSERVDGPSDEDEDEDLIAWETPPIEIDAVKIRGSIRSA